MGKETPDLTDKAQVKKKIRDARKKRKSLSYDEFEEVFAQYDIDKNGKLQYSEMNKFMKDLLLRIEKTKKSAKKGLSEKEMLKYSQDVAKLIQKYDEDRSGTLEKREVAKILNVKIPLDDSYTLKTSVKSKSKLFEGVRIPSLCAETPANTCHDVDVDSEESDEEEEEIQPSEQQSRRGSELLRKGALKVKEEEVPEINGPDNWQSAQKASFTEWVECKLSDNGSEYIVTDLTTDLGDGELLPELTQALTQTKFAYREDPKMTFHKYENIRISLDALKAAGCRFINMDVAGDLVSGNEKLCLAFTKVLLTHFGGKNMFTQPQPGLLSVVDTAQTRRRSSESVTLEKPETPRPEPEPEPEPTLSNLFQTRSSIEPIQQQIAAVHSPQDWPNNRSRPLTPELRSYSPGRRSLTPDKRLQTLERTSETPEKPTLTSERPSRTLILVENRPLTPERQIKRIGSPQMVIPLSSPEQRQKDTKQSVQPKTVQPGHLIQKPVAIRAQSKLPDETIFKPIPTIENEDPRIEGVLELKDKEAESLLPKESAVEEVPVGIITEPEAPPKRNLQPDPTLSSGKKLEFFLGRGPPPQVTKSRAISQTQIEKTPPTMPKTPPASPQIIPKNAASVMSQLRKETHSRQVALEKHTTSSETPYQTRDRESFLGLGSPARVKMKPTNLVIPQFKQNVVNGLTEIISQVNKMVEEDHERVNNLSTDWADGQIILIITDWFSPGILETYKHDHSLVKIGVSLATLKQLLDVGTKVTPMDMYMSRINMSAFRRFLSQVLWKDRARHLKPFSRTSEILSKEKEMRNIGAISASLTRKNKLIVPTGRTSPPKELLIKKTSDLKRKVLSQQFVPKRMVQLKPASVTSETQIESTPQSRKAVPGKVESFRVPPVLLKPTSSSLLKSESHVKEVPPAVSISASTSIAEDSPVSTIPPDKPPRPKFVASPNVSNASVAAPLEDDCCLSTISKRSAGTGTKRSDRGLRAKDKGDHSPPKTSLDDLRSNKKLDTEPEPPVRSTSFERGRHYSAPNKPKRDYSVTSTLPTSNSNHPSSSKLDQSKFGQEPDSSPVPVLSPVPGLSLRSTTTPPEPPPPTSRFTVTLQPNLSFNNITSEQASGPAELVTNSEDTPPLGDVKDTIQRLRQITTDQNLDLEQRMMTDADGADDNASIDSLEEIDIEYNKNVSKMIAGFIDNELDDEEKTVNATLDADSPNSPRSKNKKVRFREEHEVHTIATLKDVNSSNKKETSKRKKDKKEKMPAEKKEVKIEATNENVEEDRLDRVGKNLLQDLADYFSTSVVEPGSVADTDGKPETQNNTNSLQLEDFLSATSSFKKGYDQIDVNELVSRSLIEAGIPPETERSSLLVEESDEGFEEDKADDLSSPLMSESEQQPSYFDIVSRRTPEDNSGEGVVRR